MILPRRYRKLIGFLILSIGILVLAHEFGWLARGEWLVLPTCLLIIMLTVYNSWPRRAYAFIALVVSLMNWAWNPQWQHTLIEGLATAAFIATFFSALTTLKFAAASSPAIRRCGEFLSQQAPGRRYLALTLGGQLFGLILNYGSIQLLGAMSVARLDPGIAEDVRRHRIRRMLLAIQRGFISILPWSPFSFAIVMSTTLLPGASWSQAFLPGLVSGLLLAGLGWLLDQVFKPRIHAPMLSQPAAGTWRALIPLVFLLCLLALILAIAHWLTEVRILGLVILMTPLVSILWISIQDAGRRALQQVKRRSRHYLTVQLADLRSEMLLLMMAGYLGTVASPLLASALSQLGLDLTLLPLWLILAGIVWLMPLAGQLGMNPILVAALVAPLLPEAQSLGTTPTALVTALTAGWILSGVSSPFTATTLLTGRFANVSASHVGLRWNGVFTLLAGLILTLWVVVYASFS